MTSLNLNTSPKDFKVIIYNKIAKKNLINNYFTKILQYQKHFYLCHTHKQTITLNKTTNSGVRTKQQRRKKAGKRLQ